MEISSENKKLVKCSECFREFKSEKFLKRHIGAYHEKPRPVRVKCDQCDKLFTTNSNLNRHLRISHRIGNFRCTSCDQSFHHLALLRRHIQLTHPKANVYLCPFCNTTGMRRKDLIAHLSEMHQYSRKSHEFYCTICKEHVTEGSINAHFEIKHTKLID